MKVKFMPNVYAILGDSNTRKSSTVRALTGAPMQHNPWSVATTPPTGNIEVYVQIKALQEDNINEEQFVGKIAEVDQYHNKLGLRPVHNILIPLRISAVNGFHDGTVYLQYFAQAGWNIHQIVVLGTTTLLSPLPAGAPAPNQIPYSTTMPANQIASYIRGWWGWL
jgi:hypothetical protein